MTPSTDALRDRLDIVELHHRYAWALDHREWKLLEECFTPDGGVDYGDLGGELEGAAEIAAFCRQALEGLDASQHLIGNTMVQLEDDRATSTCYFQAQHVFAGASANARCPCCRLRGSVCHSGTQKVRRHSDRGGIGIHRRCRYDGSRVRNFIISRSCFDTGRIGLGGRISLRKGCPDSQSYRHTAGLYRNSHRMEC